ncbi:serine/threonine-protein kinase ZRK1-like isoform X2 [Malania oleifera]|uniref:serine/threonine-protein kinase ZRK1-like isoform X2 n=1 Tax=Malania oleifera TaxID=397392 RepID=UPI0025AE7142|nr:serine/threonine-protein kinase ZRK1-like isoform X2 [Malania oleifera]
MVCSQKGQGSKMSVCLRMKKKREARDEASFIKNGSMLMQELISFCNGKCNPIRNFTTKEIERVTNNYDTLSLCLARDCRLYKGFLQDRPVFVKKFGGEFVVHQFVVNSIVIGSRMSVHKNVLRLIGCCLEAQTPILVHEFAENGSLESSLCSSRGTHRQPLAWKCRLRIAMDIANVVAYLHTAFSRPIIHRDIRAASILLDKHNVAKLSDFSLCISIPDGESHVKDVVRGRIGYIAPEYLNTGFVNEKVDVFAFGMLLFVLLIGQRWFCEDEHANVDSFVLSNLEGLDLENSLLSEVVDPSILEEEGWPGKEQQLQDLAALAFKCTNKKAEDRPMMMEVAKQLRQIDSCSN